MRNSDRKKMYPLKKVISRYPKNISTRGFCEVPFELLECGHERQLKEDDRPANRRHCRQCFNVLHP